MNWGTSEINPETGRTDPDHYFEEQEETGGHCQAAAFLMYVYRRPPTFPALINDKGWPHYGYLPCHFYADELVKKEFNIGRNDPCPCESGKKWKKCCGSKVGACSG